MSFQIFSYRVRSRVASLRTPKKTGSKITPRLFSFVDYTPPDLEPPLIFSLSPADGATDVDGYTNISFEVTDSSGVDAATIMVYVDGVAAIDSGSFQAGFAGTISAITNGYTVTINPDSLFDSASTVLVEASVRDTSLNVARTSWSFTIS